MPEQTQQAVNWALQQTIISPSGETTILSTTDSHSLVEKVREYFNTNNIQYNTFNYDDLTPYFN